MPQNFSDRNSQILGRTLEAEDITHTVAKMLEIPARRTDKLAVDADVEPIDPAFDVRIQRSDQTDQTHELLIQILAELKKLNSNLETP